MYTGPPYCHPADGSTVPGAGFQGFLFGGSFLVAQALFFFFTISARDKAINMWL